MGVGHDQFALELGKHRQHPEHRAPLRRRSVNALLDDVQTHAAFPKLSSESHQMQDRSAQTVQPRDLQRVARAEESKEDVQLGAAGLGVAGVVDVDVIRGHAGTAKDVDLVIGVLVGPRDTRVAEGTASKIADSPDYSS